MSTAQCFIYKPDVHLPNDETKQFEILPLLNQRNSQACGRLRREANFGSLADEPANDSSQSKLWRDPNIRQATGDRVKSESLVAVFEMQSAYHEDGKLNAKSIHQSTIAG